MRKGNVHIDWAISLGVFLIAVTALFVFLKPGVMPVHQESVLLELVERTFLENVSWTVKRLPVFVERLDAAVGDADDPYVLLEMQDWAFSTCDNIISLAGAQGMIHSSCGQRAKLSCSAPGRGYCQELEVDTLFYPTRAHAPDPLIDFPICRSNDGSTPGTADCAVALGSTEDIKGINEQWMRGLREYGVYAEVKSKWKYPEEKHFAIFQLDSVTNTETLIIGGDPFGKRNVFTRELRYWTLDHNGNRDPLIISFRVW
ncbi:MAG: hypothetical protein AABX86_03250 [Nanoarchaeota archaeon]